jgi:hypothetical protein
MAKTKAKTRASTGEMRLKVDPRLNALQARMANVRPSAALAQTLAQEASKLADRTTLAQAARNLVSGQLTPQSALLQLVEACSHAAAAAEKSVQRAASQQARISSALRADLTRLKTGAAMPRPGKNSFALRGRVTTASGETAAGLVVEAIDRDVSQHDLLGAALTDDKGEFQILFAAKDFAESGEKGPEIVLCIGVEGEAPLCVTQAARLFGSGREANVDIALPATGAVAARRGLDPGTRLFRVHYANELARAQQQRFGEVVSELQAGLGRLIAGLQPSPSPVKGPARVARNKK